MYKQGDILTNGDDERKILGVCGDVYFLSSADNFERYSYGATTKELEESGYHLKSEEETTELTVKECAKKLGIKNLKIVKEKWERKLE